MRPYIAAPLFTEAERLQSGPRAQTETTRSPRTRQRRLKTQALVNPVLRRRRRSVFLRLRWSQKPVPAKFVRRLSRNISRDWLIHSATPALSWGGAAYAAIKRSAPPAAACAASKPSASGQMRARRSPAICSRALDRRLPRFPASVTVVGHEAQNAQPRPRRHDPRRAARHGSPEAGRDGARGDPGPRSRPDSAGTGEVRRHQPVLARDETARLGRWSEHDRRTTVRRISRSASQGCRRPRTSQGRRAVRVERGPREAAATGNENHPDRGRSRRRGSRGGGTRQEPQQARGQYHGITAPER